MLVAVSQINDDRQLQASRQAPGTGRKPDANIARTEIPFMMMMYR